MKKLTALLLWIPLLLAACGQKDAFDGDSHAGEGEVSHGLIRLGEKLDDPYTVSNMQAALSKAYPTKGRVELSATDLYVRFLPSDDAQLQLLRDRGLYLMDHPMDYRILQEGDYYHDPTVGEDDITWQYAVVPADFAFPAGVRYELLDECFLAENQPVGKALAGVDWDAVEREAFRLTGNEELLAPRTKASAPPQGRITITDARFGGGKPIGVSGVMVACNIFVKISTAYTDRDGYYQMGRTFSGRPRYRLVFRNQKGFNIGFNLILIPASVSTLGKGDPEGLDCHVTGPEDGALFRRCAVNNAAYDYFSRCAIEDLHLLQPPADLRIWILPSLECSSAPMLHHGALVESSLLKDYLGQWLALVELFLPDITIGTRQKEYDQIYAHVVHELAHASHYAQVKNDYWTQYIKYVLQSFVLEGWTAFGSGLKEGAGYCEVGEMWGFFMQESLYADRYGGSVGLLGNTYWFQPDILTYLYRHGLSRNQLFRAFTADVTSVEDLKDELINRYPAQEALILQAFRQYDK